MKRYAVDTDDLGTGILRKQNRPRSWRISAITVSATILSMSLALVAPCIDPSIGPAFARGNSGVKVSTEDRTGKTWFKASVIVDAPADLVWQSVHEERRHDPDLAYSKILEQKENECRLEQKFVLIPVIGASVCEMKNWEVPNQRIDYKLIKSDRFKAMEGSWVLTPVEKGTLLELTTHLDLGLPVPKTLMNSVTSKKLERRLGNVRKMAETLNAGRVAQSAKQKDL